MDGLYYIYSEPDKYDHHKSQCYFGVNMIRVPNVHQFSDVEKVNQVLTADQIFFRKWSNSIGRVAFLSFLWHSLEGAVWRRGWVVSPFPSISSETQ